jgi:uncharacterized protein (TIGR02996 family)
MTDQQAILQAVLDDPDDLTHRLVYADWLEEHDQARHAQFIRAQCALVPFVAGWPDADARATLGIEVMNLEPALRATLLRPFHAVGRGGRGALFPTDEIHAQLHRQFSFHVRGGFIEEIEVYGGQTLAAFLPHLPDVFAQTPILGLTLSRAGSRQAAAYAWPPERSPLGHKTLRTLLGMPAVGRLRRLDLRNLALGSKLARLLLHPRNHLSGLRRLLLDGNQIDAQRAERLQRRFGPALVLTPYDPADDIPF